jgi:hypothetical protein
MKPNPERHQPDAISTEVGDEGGSFADATLQKGTFGGPTGVDRVDPEVSGADGDRSRAASEGEQVLDDDAVVRPATEPPERQK